MPERYDTIGRVYARHRAADSRIASQIERALGSASTVLNVGAGTGAYEPRDRIVTAVEPSTVMIEQRAPDAAPVVRAVAEALPFPDGTFDVALGTFTVHHWTDRRGGLREVQRVARRQVILTFDESDEWFDRFWLTRDYLPRAVFAGTMVDGVSQVCDVIQPSRVEVVPVPFDCATASSAPTGVTRVRTSTPTCGPRSPRSHCVDDADLQPGLARFAADLESGAWETRNADILDLEALDFGYRLVVA